MDYSGAIIKEYDEMADRRVAAACRINVAYMIIVGLLNVLGIFIIEMKLLMFVVAASIIIYMLPTLLYNNLGIHKGCVRFIILFLLVVLAGLEYAVLSYHVILMLSFPLVIACLYSRNRYVIYVSVLTIPMLIVSHLAAFALKVVPDEPLVTLKGVVLYGILPRLLEMFAFIVAAYFIADRMQALVGRVLLKNKELYADQENTLTSLSEIIESQSEHTGTHVKRVALYTDIICRGLGISEEESWKISQASKMHDVGKIIVPLEILEKAGKLTPEEFEIMKTHTTMGADMLLELGRHHVGNALMEYAYQIARWHHERWDGKGYPDGLKGDEIPIAAQVVSVADVHDALTSVRVYKDAIPHKEAIQMILDGKCGTFNPLLLDCLLEVQDQIAETLARPADVVAFPTI